MANDFYTPPTALAAVTKALSSAINSRAALVETAFDKLPSENNLKRGTTTFAVDTGVANAYVISLPHAPSGYVDGLEVDFRPLNTNTTVCTINVNGLGVKSIRRADGLACAANDIIVGIPVSARYSTVTGFFHLNVRAPSSATTSLDVGTLSVSGTISGNGFTDYFASPPIIGGGTPNAATFSQLTVTGPSSVGGNFGVTGNTNIGGTLGVTGAITGNLTGNVTGNVTGNADTATIASSVTQDYSVTTAANYQLMMGTSNLLKGSAGMYANPSTNTITATTFSGALTGNASSATYSSAVTVAADGTDAEFYPLFVSATSGNLAPKLDSAWRYNPSTNALTVPELITNSLTVNLGGTTLAHLTVNDDPLFVGSTGFNASGEMARVKVGNANYGLGAKYGTGMSLYVLKTAGGSAYNTDSIDAINIAETTGAVTIAAGLTATLTGIATTYDTDADGLVDASKSVVIHVRNNTGGTLAKGAVVYISGAVGQIATIALAKADAEATSSKTLGVLATSIANNANGYAIRIGRLDGYDTSAFVDGDVVWLSATVAGSMTATKPTAPNHSVSLGVIAYSHAVNGKLAVNVLNGHEINELHDVLITTVADKDALQYESATGLWKNVGERAPAFVSGTANYVWATPNGSAGVPTLRALVAADIPLFTQVGTGAVARSYEDRDKDFISVFDFMTAAEKASVRAGDYLVDVSVAINAACDYLRTGNVYKNLYCPAGGYLINTETVDFSYIGIFGDSCSFGEVNGTVFHTTADHSILETTYAGKVAGIQFLGASNAAYTNQVGVKITGCNNAVIECCNFYYNYTSVYSYGTAFYTTIKGCTFYNHYFCAVNAVGVAAAGFDIHINDSFIQSSTGTYGLKFTQAGSVTLSRVICTPGAGMTDSTCYFESDASSSGIHQISNCVFESAPKGLYIKGTAIAPIKYVFVTNTYIAGDSDPTTGSTALTVDFGACTLSNCYLTAKYGAMVGASGVSDIRLDNCEFQVTNTPLTSDVTAVDVSYSAIIPNYQGAYEFIYLPFLTAGDISRIDVVGGQIGTNVTPIYLPSGVIAGTRIGASTATFLATPNSANLAAAVTDETGSGALVFATAPTFATSITGSYLTASEMLGTGASKEIVSLPVATYPSLTELSYVKGLSSAIQTQLGTKAASSDTTYIGTTAVALNRASAALALTGITSIDGTAATVTGATQASITSAANLVTVGALNSGSITSGFGSIDIGADSITGGSGSFSTLAASATGNTNGTGTVVLSATSTGNDTFVWGSQVLAPNLTAGNEVVSWVGRALSSKNAAYLGFNYAASGSDSNFLGLGFYAADNLLKIYPTGAITIPGAISVTGVTATGAAAPTIASATTIAPTTPIVFVSGVTTVETITAPAPISAGGGQITIIPTGIFLTGVTGNIALASTTVVGKALIMTYDATTQKFYPSY